MWVPPRRGRASPGSRTGRATRSRIKATNSAGTRPGLRRVQRRRAEALAVRARDAGRRRRWRRERRGAGHEVHRGHRGNDHRRPLLQGERQHGDARRCAVERRRHASCAQGTFSGETGSGWQTLTFATPVPVTADTTYVVSYLAPNGHYSVTGAGFADRVRQPAAARARRTRRAPTACTRTAGRPCSRPARGTPPTTGWTSCSPRELTSMRSLSVIALVTAAALLSACGDDAGKSAAPPGSPDNPLVAEPAQKSTDWPVQRVQRGLDPGARVPEARRAPVEQAADALHARATWCRAGRPSRSSASQSRRRSRRPRGRPASIAARAARSSSRSPCSRSTSSRSRSRSVVGRRSTSPIDAPTAAFTDSRCSTWRSPRPRAQRRRAVRGCPPVRDARRRALERLAVRGDATGPRSR